jgi:hypothetical protein
MTTWILVLVLSQGVTTVDGFTSYYDCAKTGLAFARQSAKLMTEMRGTTVGQYVCIEKHQTRRRHRH